jgi:hypothetical protein
LARKADSLPALSYTPADTIANAPGWRIIGQDFYTCIPPVDLPADSGVTRAIRAFCPNAIPIWRKQLYLPPGEQTRTVLSVHHGIATYVETPRLSRRLFHVEMPAHADHPTPNQLEMVFERPDPSDIGAPGLFLPWNNQVYLYLRANYRDDMTSNSSILDVIIRRSAENKERARKSHEAEEEYRQRNLQKRLDRIFENMPSDAYKQYVAAMRSPRERKRPYVFMGG